MSTHPGRSLIASLERRFGHLAIPHLVRWLAFFQLVVFALAYANAELIPMLDLDADGIFRGQIWRLLTFVFIPRTNSIIFILFAVLFLWFISDGLEHEWGPFKVNLYVAACHVCLLLLGLIPVIGIFIASIAPMVMFSSLFFAFAAIYPDQVIHLFGVIPVKAKWLALANAGILAAITIKVPFLIPLVALAFLPFLVVFVPGFVRNFKNQSDNATRRAAFQSRVKAAESGSFHTCGACGKTDTVHPELEFRVAADGEEYCSDCLATRGAKQA
jgi:hypothetical protein